MTLQEKKIHDDRIRGTPEMGGRGTHSIAGLRPYWSTHASVPMQPSRSESTVCRERQGRAESSSYSRGQGIRLTWPS
jgi:hypothetical protein